MTDPIKAQRTTVTIGSLEVDGFQLPDGSYRMSQTQVAKCVAKDESNARKFLSSKAIKRLLGESYTPGKNERIEVDSSSQTRGQTRFNSYSLEETVAFWLWEAYRGNSEALALCMALMIETLERRFDNSFGVTRTEAEYNQILSERVRQLEQDLRILGDAYAIEDDIKQENQYLKQVLRESGIDPWGLPDSGE
ncbi:hypothetical protein IQ249_22290 [Lusitaniella coriacea LEGE 07157]|uniref:Uncharacterized protein n=1 Tax=Lusitaniella coriacea LEGE 07157 TaxID=945747 RepID=A0A8J7E1N1_9CYAN|nr:hypothetical protein [Lusitaniella coriacea]MBE9118623.1 hypothetical protein [Lusitaniella coriacea LEGE 07157]